LGRRWQMMISERRRRRWWQSAAGLLLLLSVILANLGLAGTVLAFLPPSEQPGGNYTYFVQRSREKRARGKREQAAAKETARELRRQNWQRFIRRQGNSGAWQVSSWNTITGTPHRVSRITPPSFGEGVWRRLFGSEDELIDYATRFVEENKDLFRLGESEIQLVRVAEQSGIFYIDFQQVYQNIPVYGSRIWFQFDDSYRLLSFGADSYPGIEELETRPLIDKIKARQIVSEHLGTSSPAESDGESQSELVILPARFEDDLEYFLVWMLDMPGGIWRYFVDARSGQIISRLRRSRAGISGTIRGKVLPQFYNDSPAEVGLPDLYVYLMNKNEPIFQALFEDSNTPPADWKAQGLWGYGQPTPPADLSGLMASGHGGPLDPDRGHTGQKVFGYNLAGDYTNLMRPTYLTTPPISFTPSSGSKPILRFWRWLGVYKEYSEDDSGNRTSFDRASVEISANRGITWDTVWSNATSQIEDPFYLEGSSGWNLQIFDVSPFINDSSQEIRLRWGMGPTDSSGIFSGWNIDDIDILESLINPNDTVRGNFKTDASGNFQFPATWPGKNVFPNKLVIAAKLAGKYVEVYNEDSWDAVWVVENINDPNFQDPNYTYFIWDPENPNNAIAPADPDSLSVYFRISSYNELNVYYHINRMLRYIKEIDSKYDGMWRGGKKGPIKAVVKWGDYYTNAFWTPENRIYFGEGDGKVDGYRDFSLFADIIYHEYTHAITESFYSFFLPPADPGLATTSTDTTTQQPQLTTELDAMHEAFSDYWAAALTHDPANGIDGAKIGDGGFWIGHDYVRNINTDEDRPLKYPDDYGDDAYANSLILSQAMWDVRKKLAAEGREKIADIIFHKARYAGSTSFCDYLQAVLDQESRLYHDPNTAIMIKDQFGKHGISRIPLAPTNPVATVSDRAVHLTWEAPPDEDIVGYHVYYRTENDIETSREDPSVQKDAGNTTSFTITGLTNETTYVLKVKSYNKYGTESESSDYVYATPYDPKTRSGIVYQENDSSLGTCFISAIRMR